MTVIETGLYFFFILFGIFLGLYVGLSTAENIINSRKKRRKTRHKKAQKKARITERVEKKEKHILSERIQDKNSYAHSLCEFYGNNETEYVKKARKTQDSKYTRIK